MVESKDSKADKQDTLFTGDATGSATIHTAAAFAWLTNEVEVLVYEYLEAYGLDQNSLSIFHQKFWPVVSFTGGEVINHKHHNAETIAVYYLQSEPEAGGELIFHNPVPSIAPGTIHGKDSRRGSKTNFELKPVKNMLVMFPSLLPHRVLEHKGENNRWSISYDFTIAAYQNMGAGYTENTVIHPSHWAEIKKAKAGPD